MSNSCPTPPMGFSLQSTDPNYSIENPEGNQIDINPRNGLIQDTDVFHRIAQPTELGYPVIVEWFVEAFEGEIALGISFDGKPELIGPDIANFYYANDGRIIVNGAVATNAPAFGVGDYIGLYYVGAESAGAFFRNGLRVA